MLENIASEMKHLQQKNGFVRKTLQRGLTVILYTHKMVLSRPYTIPSELEERIVLDAFKLPIFGRRVVGYSIEFSLHGGVIDFDDPTADDLKWLARFKAIINEPLQPNLSVAIGDNGAVRLVVGAGPKQGELFSVEVGGGHYYE
jgi:hypothetical protein